MGKKIILYNGLIWAAGLVGMGLFDLYLDLGDFAGTVFILYSFYFTTILGLCNLGAYIYLRIKKKSIAKYFSYNAIIIFLSIVTFLVGSEILS